MQLPEAKIDALGSYGAPLRLLSEDHTISSRCRTLQTQYTNARHISANAFWSMLQKREQSGFSKLNCTQKIE